MRDIAMNLDITALVCW